MTAPKEDPQKRWISDVMYSRPSPVPLGHFYGFWHSKKVWRIFFISVFAVTWTWKKWTRFGLLPPRTPRTERVRTKKFEKKCPKQVFDVFAVSFFWLAHISTEKKNSLTDIFLLLSQNGRNKALKFNFFGLNGSYSGPLCIDGRFIRVYIFWGFRNLTLRFSHLLTVPSLHIVRICRIRNRSFWPSDFYDCFQTNRFQSE